MARPTPSVSTPSVSTPSAPTPSPSPTARPARSRFADTAAPPARTNHASVAWQLGRDIVGGALRIGSVLPNDAQLSARFGVSRTVLREALKTLSAKGLTQPQPKVGTRVRDRSCWNLFDPDILAWHLEMDGSAGFFAHLTEVRLAIEPFAAALVAVRGDPADIARLRRLGNALGDPSHTAEALALVDLDFHLVMLAAAQNPFIASVGALIETALLAAFRLSSSAALRQRRRSICVSHLKIVDAIDRRDAAGANAAMAAVIRAGRQRAISAHRPGHPA